MSRWLNNKSGERMMSNDKRALLTAVIVLTTGILLTGCSFNKMKKFETSTSTTYRGWTLFGDTEEKKNLVIKGDLYSKDNCLEQARLRMRLGDLEDVWCGEYCVCDADYFEPGSTFCTCDYFCSSNGSCRD